MSPCPNCTSTDVVTINMQLHGGPARFSHCHRCEHRWWTGENEASLPLGHVLDMARKVPGTSRAKK